MLVRQVEKGQIMEGLYEFPYFETDEKGITSHEAKEILKNRLNIEGKFVEKFQPEFHGFTRFQATLHPFIFLCEKANHAEGFIWISLKEINRLPFSSGHRRILNAFLERNGG